MKCNKCQNENICHDGNHELTMQGCAENDWCCFVPITNADRIRSMTDEELAAKIEELCQYAFMQIRVYSRPFGKAEWLDWLKQEVER